MDGRIYPCKSNVYQAQLDEYGRYCRKMGLPEQRERIYQDMRGMVATNTKKENARYTSEMMRNAGRDSKEFAKFKNILGDDAGSLAQFRQMKYNEPEKWDELKNKYKDSRAENSTRIKDILIHRSVGAKARNYEILDPETGEIFRFVEGTRIQNSEVFAGKGARKPLKEEVKEGLAEQIGGTAEKWQHCKGHGIIDYYGEERQAEVHWFQEETTGKHKFKIKRWEDED